MRILVTGGAGFIGSHLVESLAEANEVIVEDDLSNGSLRNLQSVRRKVRFLRYDISQESVVRRTGKVDGIFHLACHPRSFSFDRPARDVEVNVRSTVNMLEISRKSDAKIVFTSNSGIYGDPKYLPMDERHPIDCKTPYDVNKYASELLMSAYRKQYQLPTVACRLATVFGPRQRVNRKLGWKPVVASFVEDLLAGKTPTIFGDGEQTRDLIYVKDVASGLRMAFESQNTNGDTFNLGTGVETSVKSLLRMVADVLKKTVEPTYGPKSVGDLRRMCLSNAKARQAFALEIKYTLQDALVEYVAWYRKQNPKRTWSG